MHGGQRREIVKREKEGASASATLVGVAPRSPECLLPRDSPLWLPRRGCALFPRHPIGGPPLETGPQLRTHRTRHRLALSFSLPPSLSLFLSFSLSLCLCVSFSVSTSLCMVSRDQCQGQCHGYHGATVCWVAGFRPSPGHPSHHVRRVGQ